MTGETRCIGCGKLDTACCMSCVGVLRGRCRSLSWIYRQLQLEITRQTQHGPPNREGGKGTETPLIFDERASQAAWIILTTVHAWTEGRTTGTPDVRAVWLADNVFRYMHTGEIADCYRDITEACDVGMRVLDRPLNLYLGDCPNCELRLWGDPEKDTKDCFGCGKDWPVAELRADTRIRAREMWLTAAEAQKILGEVYGVMITRKRINLWSHRGRIQAVDGRYLVADLLDCAGNTQHSMAVKPAIN